jgi:hypothetical protein
MVAHLDHASMNQVRSMVHPLVHPGEVTRPEPGRGAGETARWDAPSMMALLSLLADFVIAVAFMVSLARACAPPAATTASPR